jgi:hypothetical protein
MENKNKEAVRYDARSFIIRGERKLLVGGEFHYFRTPAELWEDRLLKMKRSGANLVTTYIPWNWHEPEEGKQLWSGDRDLGHFLELCTKHGFFIIVKPGPYCCAELDFGGHPDWLIGKDIKLRELDDKYLSYVDAWYGRIAEVIRPFLVTNGGNVFCIQVENEYDHLINYGENEITLDDALEYFDKLKGMMEKHGIDIPKFANEAEFLRGRGIIDTRTYYTNIPSFQDWMWNFRHFDEKIMEAKKGQPDCPTMILELQVGWFSMFGQPEYIPELALTEAVSKSVLMEGASVLNYYMYAGGTTFPFWGCRGDVEGVSLRDNDHYSGDHWDGQYHYELAAKGIGLTTTFDFGGSPVREWGELMPERYYWLKAFNRFTQDFAALLLESDDAGDMVLLGGGDAVRVIGADSAGMDTCYRKYDVSKLDLITRRRGDEHLVCVRNLSEEKHMADIGFKDTGEVVFRGLGVEPRESLILPVNVALGQTGITLKKSTSELLFFHEAEGGTTLGLYGRAHRDGEAVFDVPVSGVKVISGDVQVSGDETSVTLRYGHEGVKAVQVGGIRLFVVPHELAGKVEPVGAELLVADVYDVKKVEQDGRGISVTADVRTTGENGIALLGGDAVSVANLNGEALESDEAGVSFNREQTQGVTLAWDGHWRLKSDAAEKEPAFDDSDWQVMEEPVSLENLGLFGHGYVWYRGRFELPEGLENANVVYTGNKTDRQYVYINGQIAWGGITDRVEANIANLVKPGENTIAVLYQNFYHNKSHPHEGAIIKHSGLQHPVEICGTVNGEQVGVAVSRFALRQDLSGIRAGYADMDYDDSAWISVSAGDKYVLDESAGDLLWMRRSFRLDVKPGISYSVRVTIPDAQRRCFIYVNGRAVGWFESVGPQHDFFVPESFLREDNVLTILVDGHNGYLAEPELGTFYEAETVEIELKR